MEPAVAEPPLRQTSNSAPVRQLSLENAKKSFDEMMLDAEQEMESWPLVVRLSTLTGISKARIIFGTFLAICLTILYTHGWETLANLVGFVYPVYASFKALGTKATDDDTQWLTYWIVYGCLQVVEEFTDAMFKYIPFYYSFKILFLMWCFLPQTQGAMIIFNRIISPILDRYEADIDEELTRRFRGVSQVIDDVTGNLRNLNAAAVDLAAQALKAQAGKQA